ncbi:MAG TPA: PAS domain-containing protein [Desulfobacteraceae bacterium]|nr:PAS domain-containing protein [Desulfobacteraceae bacterium]
MPRSPSDKEKTAPVKRAPASVLKRIDPAALLDAAAFGLVAVDLDERVLALNERLATLIGVQAQDALGLPCVQVLRNRSGVQRCGAGETLESEENVSRTDDLITRDRRRIPVRISVSPLADESGLRIGYLKTVEDLSGPEATDHLLGSSYGFGAVIGRSLCMQRLFSMLPVVAQSDASVLITGETGTGKDLLAEAIHQASDRAKGPFVKINCGALPATLLESELFGHKKGAFTGAVEDRPGRFRMAHRGTLYLTEIGDLPLALQVKLLTFLDDKVVYPLGGTVGHAADVRVVAATHRDLGEMVRRGRFREDLFYRLNVLRLQVPSLREREGDIPLLLDYFLKRHSAELGRPIQGFAPRTLKILLGYDYPGNVRELKNIAEHCAHLCQEKRVQPVHLPAYLTEKPVVRQRPAPAAAEAAVTKGPGPGENGTAPEAWSHIEARLIREALVKARGHRGRAAQIVGCARSTLWRKIKHYGIEV